VIENSTKARLRREVERAEAFRQLLEGAAYSLEAVGLIDTARDLRARRSEIDNHYAVKRA
jgi:hypothetical protein